MKADPVIRNLILSLTGTCNYACAYCYAAYHPEEQMPVDTALKAVDMAGQSGQPFILQFTGGEPLLAFPVIQAVTEHVAAKGYPAIIQLQTNASLMTDAIAEYLKHHKIAVGVSLDGRPPINDSLRKMKNGNSASEATIRGIRLLAAKKIPIGLTCVVTDANVKALPGIVQMAYYLGSVLICCGVRGGEPRSILLRRRTSRWLWNSVMLWRNSWKKQQVSISCFRSLRRFGKLLQARHALLASAMPCMGKRPT